MRFTAIALLLGLLLWQPSLGAEEALHTRLEWGVGFAWQLFVPALESARDLEHRFNPALTLTAGLPSGRADFAARSGIWYFEGEEEESFTVTIVPFLVGADYRAAAFGPAEVVARLLLGASWIKVRSPERDAGEPFENATFKETDLRWAGSGGLLLRVDVSEHCALETGVTLDVVLMEDWELPGFVGLPFGLLARL